MKLQEEHHEFILDDELKRHEVICNQVVLGGIWGDVAEIVPKNWGGYRIYTCSCHFYHFLTDYIGERVRRITTREWGRL